MTKLLKETRRQRDLGTKRLLDKETGVQRRNREQRDWGTKKRGKKTGGQGDLFTKLLKETRRQRDLGTKG